MPKIGSYKGRTILTINPEDRFPFSFGIAKAKLILNHISDIEEFVQEHDVEAQAANTEEPEDHGN